MLFPTLFLRWCFNVGLAHIGITRSHLLIVIAATWWVFPQTVIQHHCLAVLKQANSYCLSNRFISYPKASVHVSSCTLTFPSLWLLPFLWILAMLVCCPSWPLACPYFWNCLSTLLQPLVLSLLSCHLRRCVPVLKKNWYTISLCGLHWWRCCGMCLDFSPKPFLGLTLSPNIQITQMVHYPVCLS